MGQGGCQQLLCVRVDPGRLGRQQGGGMQQSAGRTRDECIELPGSATPLGRPPLAHILI
jgi:hypothetical protein